MRKILILILSSILSVSFLSMITVNIDATNPPIWPTFQYDSRNSGLCPYSGPEKCSLKWIASPDRHFHSPVIDNEGTIYAMASGNLIALDRTGTILWEINVGIYEDKNTPAISDDGTIYVGVTVPASNPPSRTSSKLLAVSKDGSLIWSTTIPQKQHTYREDHRISTPVKIGLDGTIYVHDEEYWEIPHPGWIETIRCGVLYAFDPAGHILWSKVLKEANIFGTIPVTPAFGSDGTIYAMSPTTIFAINPDGTTKWSYQTGLGERMVPPTVAQDDTIYIGGAYGKMQAFSSQGDLKWVFSSPTGGIGSSVAVDNDENLYFSTAGTLYSLDKLGSVRWSALGYPSNQMHACPIISRNGLIYLVGTYWSQGGEIYDDPFPTPIGIIYTLKTDGSIINKYELENAVFREPPALSNDGVLYVPSQAGLYAFAPETAADFEISVSPPSQSVGREESIEYEITVTSINDFESEVSLYVLASYADLGIDFYPPEVTPPPSGATGSILTITTTDSTPYMGFEIEIFATGGGIPHKSIISLSVDKRDLAKKYFPYMIFDDGEAHYPTNFYYDDNSIDNNPTNYDITWPTAAYVHMVEGSWKDKEYLAIEYWFYYVRDTKFWDIELPEPLPPCWLAHDHDWESVYVFLLKEGTDYSPYSATYFRHFEFEGIQIVDHWQPCPWESITKVDQTHPLVYVAVGSHASYQSALPYIDIGWPIYKLLDRIPIPEFVNGGPELQYTDFDMILVPDPQSSWPDAFGQCIDAPWARTRWNDPFSYIEYKYYKAGLSVAVASPVDILVTDPAGRRTGFDPEAQQVVNEIPGAAYTGPLYEPEVLTILEPLKGEYEVMLTGTEDGSYTMCTAYGTPEDFNTTTHIANITMGKSRVFTAKVSEIGLELYMNVDVDIDPDTLNLKSNGEWVTAYIELPAGYNLSNVDISTVQMNNTISVDSSAPTQIGDYDLDGVPDLMVKFDRASIIEWLGAMDYSEETGKSCLRTITIKGKVLDMPFEGSDTIKTLRK